MFPLAGNDFPKTADELGTAIERALQSVFHLKKGSGVTVTGGDDYPHVARVQIDLDGARVNAADAPPKPAGVGKRKRGITVDRLELSGQPILYEKTKLALAVNATGLKFDFDRDAEGRPLLVLADADDGTVDARIKKKDIEALLFAAAAFAAQQQGVTVQQLDLDLTSSGARSVAADVRVKAKKLMMSGVVHVSGAVDVDDELNAVVSGLACRGEGMVGGAAAGFLKKHLSEYDGRAFPLMAFSLGDLRLRDLALEIDDALHVSATFGKSRSKPPRKAKKTLA